MDKKAKIVLKTNTCYQAFDINKIIDENGNEIQPKKITAFCRCGESKDKPFCDGHHHNCKFKSE